MSDTGPGMIKAEEFCLLQRKSETEEVVQSMASGLVHFHMGGMLAGEPFAMSKNWLVLGRAVSPQSTRPQMLKHQEHRKQENVEGKDRSCVCLL